MNIKEIVTFLSSEPSVLQYFSRLRLGRINDRDPLFSMFVDAVYGRLGWFRIWLLGNLLGSYFVDGKVPVEFK